MKLLHPIRLGVLLTLVTAATVGVLFVSERDTSANVVAGEYSMEVNITPTTAAVGGPTFVATLAIVHSNPLVDCTDGTTNGIDDDGDTVVDNPEENGLGVPLDNPPFPCYAAAQWNLDYDETLVDLPNGSNSIARVATAPSQYCVAKN